MISGSRLLLIAPHPDDEALAASVILQRAVGAGADVRVLYATDGDDNPWPQRLLEKKWSLDASDRKRWGELRRDEALAALRILGVAENKAQFLGLPDQGLTDLLLRDGDEVASRILQVILDWRPNEILAPAVYDTHPDHSALAVLVRMALTSSAGQAALPPVQWSYLVHGRSKIFGLAASHLSASESECARKRSAILCHRTQVRLSRRRFLGYVARPERFAPIEPKQAMAGEGALRFAYRSRSMLCLRLHRTVKPWMASWIDTILLMGRNRKGEACSMRLRMPACSSLVTLEDGTSGAPMGVAAFHGDAFAGRLFIPTELFSSRHSLFVKLQCRAWFFDEAGWLEIAAVKLPSGRVAASRGSRAAATSVVR